MESQEGSSRVLRDEAQFAAQGHETGDHARAAAFRYSNGTQQHLGARLHARHDV